MLADPRSARSSPRSRYLAVAAYAVVARAGRGPAHAPRGPGRNHGCASSSPAPAARSAPPPSPRSPTPATTSPRTDVARPSFEADRDGVAYKQGDLTDAGDAFAIVRGHDAVVHAAAIPEPTQNPPHVVFRNNLMATFNALEAAVRWGVPRFVNLSSETVPGFFFPERPFLPDYLPVDEEHPIRPQDPYATAKHFGEQLMDGATRRVGHHRGLDPPLVGAVGGQLRDATSARGCASRRRRRASGPTSTSTTSRTRSGSPPRRDTPGHEVVYIASPDIASHEPLEELARRFHGDAAPPIRATAASNGISIAKARRLLGYDPQRSWRDYLDDDGRLRPAARERLERGETGVQRGRRLTGAA